MSKKATEIQRKAMSRMYRGKEIFKPLQTGWIDEHVACVREWVANIFFYRKGDTTIMIDAGYNYGRLEEKMGWLGIDPKSIRHILNTHHYRSPQILISLYMSRNTYLMNDIRHLCLKGIFLHICIIKWLSVTRSSLYIHKNHIRTGITD